MTMRFLGKLLAILMTLGIVGAIAGLLMLYGIIQFYSRDLPDLKELEAYTPAVVTRVHAGDGKLLAEFASERRIFVPIGEVPPMVKNAFLAAEDQNFYSHKGIDPVAITRALLRNFQYIGSKRRPEGASTITQQVAKNFLLSNEVSYARKIREAILAFRIEKALSKDRILELYLNEIFLGNRSYGIGAAALNYFDKSLSELTVAEAAYLAALPKAPNNYHPVRNKAAATDRRDHVVRRMLANNFISRDEAEEALEAPLIAIARDSSGLVNAPYFAEEVRRELMAKYGGESLYKGGLSIRTSVNPEYQRYAEEALRDGLLRFDRRKGWRGGVGNLDTLLNWQDDLAKRDLPEGMLDQWELAVVTGAADGGIQIGTNGGDRAKLHSEDVTWVQAGKNVKKGEIVMVEHVEGDPKDTYRLRQIPAIQGAILVMDPHTGRVLAMQGGWQYGKSVFNRATQAERQPGSAFKPFVYLTALEQGLNPSTLVMDAPFEIMDRPGHYWRPQNYTDDYLGPTTMRVGVEKSRNLMTVRLAEHIGMKKVSETARKFGIEDKMEPRLSYALGAGETTLLRMTGAYAILVNGGKKVTPTFIDRIQDRNGQTIFKHDQRPCAACGPKIRWEGQAVPEVPEKGEQVVDPRVAYQMVSILEGVVQRGTATRLKALNRPVAGKTGTTNESRDVWFMGFTPDLVVGVYFGYDQPRTLGKKETGGSVAAPVFGDFMAKALKDVPATPFRIPPGMRLIPVDPRSGSRTSPTSPGMIWEAFLPGQSPDERGPVISDGGGANWTGPSPSSVDPAVQQWQQNPDMAWPGQGDPNAPQPLQPTAPQPAVPGTAPGTLTGPPLPQPVYPQPSQPPQQQQQDDGMSGTGGLY
jgi:penicillin-binding protein 1A